MKYRIKYILIIILFIKDLGLLILDKPLGLYSGWFGLACLTDPNIKTQKVNITGYPQDQEENNQVC